VEDAAQASKDSPPMTEVITLLAAFVLFLGVAVVLATAQARNGTRPSLKLRLDKRTGETFWVDEDGRRMTLEEYRDLRIGGGGR